MQYFGMTHSSLVYLLFILILKFVLMHCSNDDPYASEESENSTRLSPDGDDYDYNYDNDNDALYNRSLYWIPNNSGVFSHYLQLKVILATPSFQRMNIIIAPTLSKSHYGDDYIDMCSIFQLPSHIKCSPVPHGMQCYDKLPRNWSANMDHPLDLHHYHPPHSHQHHYHECLCYKGSITFDRSDVTARDIVLRAVDSDVLSLSFSDRSMQLMHRFRSTLLKLGHSRNRYGNGSNVTVNSSRSDDDLYTVVHWRRGDQLNTRCKKMLDISVNCQDAYHLIDRVSKSIVHNPSHNISSIIYIATNEPQGSSAMETLRRHGYLTYQDIMMMDMDMDMEMMNNKQHLSPINRDYRDEYLSVFDVLVVETLLMIDADVFLAWGISEINDIVEYERRAVNKTHCIDQSIPPDTKLGTWCGLHKT
jgi:hypothetical protein